MATHSASFVPIIATPPLKLMGHSAVVRFLKGEGWQVVRNRSRHHRMTGPAGQKFPILGAREQVLADRNIKRDSKEGRI